jgi:hypothetical protein
MKEIIKHEINLPIDEYYAKHFAQHSYAIYPLLTVQNDHFQSNIQDYNKTEAWNLTSAKLCYTFGLNHGMILILILIMIVIIIVLTVVVIYKRYKNKTAKSKRWIYG